MNSSSPPIACTVDELIQRYGVLLLDAYGVLLHHGGALHGAHQLITRLHQQQRPYFILTNDASRLPTSAAARLARFGLPIPAERIITSGSLLQRYFHDAQLVGQQCIVLGPEDSQAYVRQAGGVVVTVDNTEASVAVVCDEVGYPFVETLDQVLTQLLHRLDRRQPCHLILPNPDLIYPKGELTFGFTAGSIAQLIEAALHQRYPDRDDLFFVRLGKPNRFIFEEARRRAGVDNMVMIGDQLGTDIKGALDFGIPAALVQSGLDRYNPQSTIQPTYLLDSLA